jgi:serine/threonine protein kinase
VAVKKVGKQNLGKRLPCIMPVDLPPPHGSSKGPGSFAHVGEEKGSLFIRGCCDSKGLWRPGLHPPPSMTQASLFGLGLASTLIHPPPLRPPAPPSQVTILDEITEARRVYREIKILRNLDHANVLNIYEIIAVSSSSSSSVSECN